MTAWWNSLTGIEQVFALMAIPATLLLLIQTVLLIFGLGGDHGADLEVDHSALDPAGHDISFDQADHDVSTDHDHDNTNSYDHGLRIFTVRGFVAFFSVFGWCGLACLQGDINISLSVLISFIAGLASMVIIALLLRAALGLQSSGTLSMANAVGKSASVYMRVPADRAGRGKVNLIVQGSYIEADALTDEKTDLLPNHQVTVIGLASPNTLLVAKKIHNS
ncbi:MAG: hypothetical protein LBB91_03435 [Clostridiales bacterium]|jgi:membrane protein implicated in regulation of membrane protease activity|nr:hypothetical protein [Clostridiales bacterium]